LWIESLSVCITVQMEKRHAMRVGITLPADGTTLNFVVTGEADCFRSVDVHFDLGWNC
jgi:hypothetical protein